METSDSGAAPQQGASASDVNAETVMNLALLDPPRFGWSATGGVVDVLPPHDRARRSSTRETHVKMVRSRERRRERIEARKKKEASAKILSGTDQLTERMMMERSFADSKLPAVDHAAPKDPPPVAGNAGNAKQHVSNRASTVAQVTASGSAAAAALKDPPAVPGNAGKTQQNVSNGAPTAAHATVSGLASSLMAAAAGILAVRDTTPKAASLSDTQSVAMSEQSVASQASRGPASPEPILARINESDASRPISVDPAAASDSNAKESTADNAKESTLPAPSNDRNAKESTSHNVIKVKALNDDGVLDMYTYHRGREGMEPRDEETGELLCDVEPTDTNHGWEPPNMKISINIAFPLSDSVGEADEHGESKADANVDTPQTRRQTQEQKQDSGLQYTETIEWDLAEPRTMTPMCFATGVSEEFGLDAGQTLELAESIQKQINYFVQNKVSYKSPLTLLDANGNERAGASVHSPNMRGPPQLFGSATGETKAGMPIPQKLLQTTKSTRTAGASYREPILLDGLSRERTSFPSDVEPEYREEVLRRARESSRKDIAKKSTEECPGGLVGVIEKQDHGVCHSCTSRKSRTWKLACDNPYHALCSRHITGMLEITIDDSGDPVACDYCPICALQCDCKKCTRRFSLACAEFKTRCIDEGVPPEQASFDGILRLKKDRRRSSARSKATASRTDRAKQATIPRITVPKVPVSDFPREVCGGRDLDPGTKDDYRTVYTAEGSFLRNDAPVAEDAKLPAAPPSNGVQEDGNVDYCHTCRKHGNLLCCDFCPRAFHPECITPDEPTGAEGAWECFVCRQEKDATDDVVTGESSLDLVCASFVDFKHSEGIDKCAQVLALIHETLLKLMDYDFGYLFRKPVDCEAIPGYSTIVKKPMDLGTIATRIVNGEYAAKYRDNLCWDDVLAAVLQDIELVWHNCFTFNYDGSSIYRMAEVQRRKYERIRKRSFDFLLSLEIKRRVDEYVSQCELERSKMPRMQVPTSSDRRTNGRHKVTVGKSKKTNKIVVVLDPDTGLLVKMYSAFKGAALAALFLVGLGHPMEFPTLSDHSLKKIVQGAVRDPALLLFGYRWLYMEDLVKGKVKFGMAEEARPAESALENYPSGTVEVKIGNESYVFLSIEEAVSWPDLPDNIPMTEIRRKLLEIPYGEWATIGGLSWRKLEQRVQEKGVSTISAHSQVLPEENAAACLPGENGNVSLTSKCLIVDVSKYPFPPNVGFVKEDLITRRVLTGFESAVAAHVDWLRTREYSPVCSVDEPTDFDYFSLGYLDGERNIDGMIWRTVQASGPDLGTGAASNVAHQDVANSSEQETTSASQLTGAPKMGMESVSQSLGTDNGLAPTNGDPVGVVALSSLPQGETAELEKGGFSNQQFERTNGHFPALQKAVNASGDFVGAKRSHENDNLGSCRANKKTAVCYN